MEAIVHYWYPIPIEEGMPEPGERVEVTVELLEWLLQRAEVMLREVPSGNIHLNLDAKGGKFRQR